MSKYEISQRLYKEILERNNKYAFPDEKESMSEISFGEMKSKLNNLIFTSPDLRIFKEFANKNKIITSYEPKSIQIMNNSRYMGINFSAPIKKEKSEKELYLILNYSWRQLSKIINYKNPTLEQTYPTFYISTDKFEICIDGIAFDKHVIFSRYKEPIFSSIPNSSKKLSMETNCSSMNTKNYIQKRKKQLEDYIEFEENKYIELEKTSKIAFKIYNQLQETK